MLRAMNRRAMFVAAALLCANFAVGCATSAQGQLASSERRYRVRVQRRVAVGARFRVEGRGEIRRRTETIDSFRRRVGGDEELLTAEFAGEATVRALNDEGYVSSIEVVVRRAVADNGERSSPYLEAGSTITITTARGAEPRVERDGASVDPIVVQFLSLAYDLGNLYGYPASFFGPGRRRAVGERWPVPALSGVTVATGEATLVREDGTRETVTLPSTTSTESTAEATLVRLLRVDGVSCIEVQSTLRTTMPANSNVEAQQTNEWTMTLPRSRRRPPLGMATRNTIDSWTGGVVDGRPVREHMLGERTTIVRFSEIP